MNKRQAIKIYRAKIIEVEHYENTKPEDRILGMTEKEYFEQKKLCEKALKIWRKRN